MTDYYDILGVSAKSEPEVITAAYKAMMRKYHPDTNKSLSASDKAKRINEAYDVLKSPLRRREYDAKRGQTRSQKSAPPPPPPPPPPQRPSPAESSTTAGTGLQRISGANVGFIGVLLLPVLALAFFAFVGGRESSPAAAPALVSDAVRDEPSTVSNPVNEEPVVDQCATDVEKENWQGALVSCSIAAGQGDLSAQHRLGRLYSLGNGVSTDKAEAARWYRTAADRGYAHSQVSLGYLYSIGEGVVEDDAEAVRLYQKAAEQGDPRGQAFLGIMYSDGEGIEKDFNNAVRWYRKSADQGYVMGQALLGFAYEFGEGVEKDLNEAIRWYRMAADQGDESSQQQLRGLGQ